MQIITAAISKGGVAKTTTMAALAQAAAYRGRKVLAVDLDPQGNLSFALAADPTDGGSDLLLSGTDPAELIQETAAGIDVIPASIDLAAEQSSTGSARRLQNALDPIRDYYDLIVIDTGPAAGELQYNALMAATGLIIPLETDAYCVNSLYQAIQTAQKIQGSNPALQILGFILTKHDARSTVNKQLQEIIKERSAAIGVPYLGTIRKAVAVKEAATLQKSLFEYAPKSKPAQDYLQIFDALKI